MRLAPSSPSPTATPPSPPPALTAEQQGLLNLYLWDLALMRRHHHLHLRMARPIRMFFFSGRA